MKDIKGSFLKSRHSKYSSIASRHKSCFSMQIPVDVRSLMKSSWTNLRIFSLVNLPLLLWVNIPLRSISRMRKSMQRLVSTPMMQRRLKLETYLLAWSECQSISTVRFHNVSNKALKNFICFCFVFTILTFPPFLLFVYYLNFPALSVSHRALV